MTRPKFGIIVAFIFSFALLAGCGSADTSNSNSSNTANQANSNSHNSGGDSAEELGSLVRVPFEPEEATWRLIEVDGKRRLVAVILFTSDDHRLLASKYDGTGTDVQVNVQPWFPVELTAAGETTGENVIPGKAFPATEFYQEPYTSGNVVFIPETNYVVLDLGSN